MISQRGAKISIDLNALQHNFEQVKKYAAMSKIMPVIKANAYGHGILQVTQALDAADGFAVAQLSEAVFLRDNGMSKPITVFQGYASAQQLDLIFQHTLRPAISQVWQLDLLEASQQTDVIDVWLKINTGMGRLGVQLVEVDACYQRLVKSARVNQIGFMMHFANADEPQHLSNQKQIKQFLSVLSNHDVQSSASNSAAIISGLIHQQDWVRPGIMLYGSSPFADKTATELNLKPVMKLHAELIAINELKKDQTVGYGDRWVCPQDMRVGIVNIGYGDGYPRHATSAPFAINGQRCLLIGRVSMDSIAVDLRGVEAQCGDQVECWGEQISIDDVAKCADTLSYELLCSAGRV
jgi:alanine racemase